MIQQHVIVTGKVQGVWYRVTARNCAKELGLLGWIRNTADGKVEIMVCGDEDTMDRFIAWCHTGPEGAEVKTVETRSCAVEAFDDFSIVG